MQELVVTIGLALLGLVSPLGSPLKGHLLWYITLITPDLAWSYPFQHSLCQFVTIGLHQWGQCGAFKAVQAGQG